MIQATKNYLTFLRRSARIAFVGDWRYYTWMGALTVLCLLGLNAYCKQFAHGLITTGMSDEVSWGVYIANFTFLVGVAAAAVMMVIPVYIYNNEELHDLVIFGELLAVAAILMCLAFVTVDLGRPDRFWHLIPGIGQFNFPASMLSWDVIALNGYLVLNVHICGYLLYCRYQKKMPAKWFYVPFVFIAIIWAISIHTVTAFLYVGLGGRPFWNQAIIGPRFLASAFTAGPALIILAIQVVRRVTATFPAGEITRRSGLAKTASSRAATSGDLELLALHLSQFGAVPKETRLNILPTLTVLDVAKGDVLLRQGETDKHAFFVLKGRVVVEREESGRHRITRSAGPGEQFGEVSALAGSPRHPGAARASRCLAQANEAARDEQNHPRAHGGAAHDYGPRPDDLARHCASGHDHQRVSAGVRNLHGVLRRRPAYRLLPLSLPRFARPSRLGSLDMDSHRLQSYRDGVAGVAPQPKFEMAQLDLCVVLHRHLD
jgi:formate-dependent nitrite reductase membrane component NrfD